jgi:predicted small lipoprotein YifL
MHRLLLIVAFLALSSCGLKDDLYLPEPAQAPPPVVTAPVSAEMSEEEEKEESKPTPGQAP